MTRQLVHKGCTLTYSVEGIGPPVLLIQGAGVHGSGWQPQVAALRSNYRCLTFDNRGIGLSQPGSPRLSVEEMAGDAGALMQAEGWESAHVVGHSLGGLVALRLALSERRHVRSLTLLCTFAQGRAAAALSPWMVWVGLRTRIGTRVQRRNAFLQLVLPPEQLQRANRDILAAHLGSLFGHDLADQPPAVMSQLTAMRAYDASAQLQELAGIPTLVISAALDRIARPEHGRAIAAGIPGARYVEVPDASHGAPIQAAETVNSLLIDHLSQAEKHAGVC